ncbi:MAG: S1C family serine protease, partial [Chthoniobacterales bacterium]
MTLKRASFLAICFSATLLAETSVPSGSGSGFFITPNGFFLTNYHVVKGAEKIQIRVGDKMLEARLIKFDRINDIAILKVDGEFASLPIGQADKVSLGDDVFTIGFPAPQLQGFAPKLTKGNISAASGLQDDPRFFQISIPIQPGNSGGPLVDEQGNAVGIVCSTLSPAIAISEGFIPQNVNFAMKTSYAVPLIGMIPDIRDKLLAPATSTTKTLSQVVAEAEKAVGLVVVYSQGVKEQHQSTVTARAGGEVADGGSAAPDTSEITRKMKRLEHRLVAAFSAQN